MRAVIYTRVSQDKRDRASVQQQEDEARLAAAAMGWTIVRVFVDNDRSASEYAKRAREQYAELGAYLDTAEVDVLVLWESSRGSRDNEEWNVLLKLCERREIRIHVVDHRRTYDLSVPRDWRSMAEDGVDSAYESKKGRNRILRSMRANATTGRPHGKLAYGYSREYDERGQFVRQYEREDQAEVIRECGRRVVAGESLYAIANDLNERGVPAPAGGRWLPGQIKRLVTNPRYVGQRVHRGQVIGEAVWPAILDEDTYLDCKAILGDPRRRTVRDRSLRYLLSGAALCGVCEGRMRVIKNRGYLAYACYEKFCVGVKVEYLEAFVVEVILARLERPDFLAAVAARKARSARAAAKGQDEADELQGRLDGFYAASAAGDITPAGLAAVEARLIPQIEAAKQRDVAARVPAVLREVAGKDIRERWPNLAVGTRRVAIATLITVHVDKTVRGSRFNPERVRIDWKSI